jgi:hypothetical protein
MLLFGVSIPVTVPQRSEIPEGLINYPVFFYNANFLLLQIEIKLFVSLTYSELDLQVRYAENVRTSLLLTELLTICYFPF